MDIRKNTDGNNLTVEVAGRLDTTTAPELEKALSGALTNVKNLVFDFSGLDYISSVGLRVLLATQKTMNRQGTMVIRNANESVNEVFEITGLADIFTIE